jgi:acyl-CoA thioester hydrolase
MSAIVHRFSVRVRFHECDLYGHVNHAVYLQYLETARVQLLSDRALPIRELQRLGINLVVRRISIEYLRPAFLDDELEVTTEVQKIGGSSGAFRQVVARGSETVAEAVVEWACLGADGRPARLPQPLRDLRPGQGTRP